MARRRIGFDRSAYAFAVAARLADATQIRAVNGLTIGTKFDGLWPLIQCLYPFVGGDAVRHSWNAKNVATNRITWAAATHDSNGVTLGLGVNTTGYTLPNNSPYLGTYITGGAGLVGSDFYTGFSPRVNFSVFNGVTHSDLGDFNTGRLSTSLRVNANRYAATTRSSGISYIFDNASISVSGATSSANMPTNRIMRLSNTDADGVNGRRTALCVIAQSLTPAQHTLLYDRIQTFQEALGRAVAPQ
jgi:hypothetical protein